MEGNYFLEIFIETLRDYGWVALDFEYWKISALWNNRSRCSIIQLHWPESYWRSESMASSMVKAIHFIVIHKTSRIFGYKWMFIAHNVDPHYKVKSSRLERFMRRYLLSHVDCVVGLAINTKKDLLERYNTHGKIYIQARHSLYKGYYVPDASATQLRMKYGIGENKIILWLKSSEGRSNQGTLEFVSAWSLLSQKRKKNFVLLYTHSDEEENINLQNDDTIIPIAGFLRDVDMANIATIADYLIFSYTNITTSGMFYFALTMDLCIIAPTIPFFKDNSSTSTSILYDRQSTAKASICNILRIIDGGWECNIRELNKMKQKHEPKVAYGPIADFMDTLRSVQ